MAAKYPILILTEETDEHADAVIRALHGQGQEVARIHTADIPQETSLAAWLDGSGWRGTVTTPLRVVPLEDVRSVWYRRPGDHVLPDTLDRWTRQFCLEETGEAARGSWALLESSAYWVSYPTRIREASFKLEQLRRAAWLGMDIPRTLATNEAAPVREFYQACNGKMIYKTLATPIPALNMLPDDAEKQKAYAKEFPKALWHRILTTPITEPDLELLDTLRLAPGLFQEYIPKRVELRVTVIGDEVFTAEIHSQEHPDTQHDFRNWHVNFDMAPHTLPDDIEKKMLELTRSYGLSFSTSDFILTPDGQYVFLEMNPNGQWLWVEGKVPSLRMVDAMTACLIRGSHS